MTSKLLNQKYLHCIVRARYHIVQRISLFIRIKTKTKCTIKGNIRERERERIMKSSQLYSHKSAAGPTSTATTIAFSLFNFFYYYYCVVSARASKVLLNKTSFYRPRFIVGILDASSVSVIMSKLIQTLQYIYVSRKQRNRIKTNEKKANK